MALLRGTLVHLRAGRREARHLGDRDRVFVWICDAAGDLRLTSDVGNWRASGSHSPLLGCAAILAASFVILTLTRSAIAYLWSMCAFGVVNGTGIPYLMGPAATPEPSGLLARQISGVMPLATALAVNAFTPLTVGDEMRA
jgi:hypothetical protein